MTRKNILKQIESKLVFEKSPAFDIVPVGDEVLPNIKMILAEKKLGKFKLILIGLLLVWIISSVSAVTIGTGNVQGVNIEPPTNPPIISGANYSINVNNSQYLQGYTPQSFTLSTILGFGSNAQGLGIYNLTKITDSNNGEDINFLLRQLYNSLGDEVANWDLTTLYDDSGPSINWDDRVLYNHNEQVILNYSLGTLISPLNFTAPNICYSNGTNCTMINSSYYLTSNPFGFYNSTTLPASGNPFNQSLNTTDNVTFNKVTINSNTSTDFALDIQRTYLPSTNLGGIRLYEWYNGTQSQLSNIRTFDFQVQDLRNSTSASTGGELSGFSGAVQSYANITNNAYTMNAFKAQSYITDVYKRTSGLGSNNYNYNGIDLTIGVGSTMNSSKTTIDNTNGYRITYASGFSPVNQSSASYGLIFKGFTAEGTADGTTPSINSTGYGFYNSLTGFNKTWGFYNAVNTNNNLGTGNTTIGNLNVTTSIIANGNTGLTKNIQIVTVAFPLGCWTNYTLGVLTASDC